jgi:transcriptional regulator with XRE-family HTH domain
VSPVVQTQPQGGRPTAPGRGRPPEISPAPVPVGVLIRAWRERRNLSQQRLAEAAAVSTRHLSFLETGRSSPSRAMVRGLAEQLELPLRERNRLLLAAGFAPDYDERPLERDRPHAVRAELARFLRAHEPYPAIMLDRHFNLVDENSGFRQLTAGVARDLLGPPANALRICLHPRGLAPEIVNLSQWSAYSLRRLRRRARRTRDGELDELYEELAGYPGVSTEPPSSERHLQGVAMLHLRGDDDELAFFSTTTHVGDAVDVALSELTIEALHPADAATAAACSPSSGSGSPREPATMSEAMPIAP